MKIKIMKPGAAVTMEFEEMEAEEMFKDIAARMIGIERRSGEVEGTVPAKSPRPEEYKITSSPIKITGIAPAQTAAEEVKAPDPGQGDRHSGFLYIKCEHCGNERAYCQKAPSGYSICTKCGSRTYFTDPLKQILVSCECGQRSRYLTNMTADMFDINCVNCKAPVAVKYNHKRGRYETIR